jgi:hypothetical protein
MRYIDSARRGTVTLAILVMGTAGPTVACRATDDLVAPNVASAETLAQVAASLMALEREKVELAFGTPTRSPAQVKRFLSMYAPEFVSINLGPTGVSQTKYSDLEPQLAFFPAMPYTITNMSAVAINPNSTVVKYEVTLQTPGGAVHYLASSTWSLRSSGEWQTIFYQATPL